MKTSIFGLILFFIGSLPLTVNAQQNANDKDFLLNYFEETVENLKNEISGLSEEQMHFKPSENEWSISQCLEHIVLTENMLFEMAKAGMEKPENPERKEEVQVKDEQLIEGINDRSHKAQASDELTGEGKYDNPEEGITELQLQREKVLGYIQEASLEAFRNHISDSPFGPIDGYQSMLFIAGHTARHTLQIAEVKANENFPSE